MVDVGSHWERLAADDPFWAVLTAPAMRGRLWDPAKFYSTGEAEVATILRRAVDAGASRFLTGSERARALDIGCGVGRATFALGRRFGEVVGVDIAPSMLREARGRIPDGQRVRFTRSSCTALPFRSGSFRCVYSMLVLQHQPTPDAILAAVSEIVRVLEPGGLAAFQAPVKCLASPENGQTVSRIDLPDGEANMLMTSVSRERIIRVVEDRSCRVMNEHPDPMTGPGFESLTFLVAK